MVSESLPLRLEAKQLDDVLAGRPKAARYDLIKAVELILRAGESK